MSDVGVDVYQYCGAAHEPCCMEHGEFMGYFQEVKKPEIPAGKERFERITKREVMKNSIQKWMPGREEPIWRQRRIAAKGRIVVIDMEVLRKTGKTIDEIIKYYLLNQRVLPVFVGETMSGYPVIIDLSKSEPDLSIYRKVEVSGSEIKSYKG